MRDTYYERSLSTRLALTVATSNMAAKALQQALQDHPPGGILGEMTGDVCNIRLVVSFYLTFGSGIQLTVFTTCV